VESVKETSVFRADACKDLVIELFKEFRFDFKIVLEALGGAFCCKFCGKLGGVPNTEIRPVFKVQHKDNDQYNDSADDPIGECLGNMFKNARYEIFHGECSPPFCK